MPSKPLRASATAAAVLAALALSQFAIAQSPSVATSTFTCSAAYVAVGSTTLSIPAADVGLPGFVALVAERGDDLAFLNPHGQWIYSRMPFAGEYRILNALPSSFQFDFCIPEPATDDYGNYRGLRCAVISGFAQGTILHATWGALTPEIEAQADAREATIQRANERLARLGRSTRVFDRQRFIESAVLRDARMKNPVVAGTVPFVDCTPPDTGGGN